MTFPEMYDVLNAQRVPVSDEQKEKLESFFLGLTRANKIINLISRKETDVIGRHFLNSALIAPIIDFQPATTILDVGTGGGFPGIIMAILFPSNRFTLAESVKKKTGFLQEAVVELGLENVSVHNGRVERMQGRFDFVTCRAVAKIQEIKLWTNALLKPGGTWIMWKGRRFEDEIGMEKAVIHNLADFHPSQDGVILTIRR